MTGGNDKWRWLNRTGNQLQGATRTEQLFPATDLKNKQVTYLKSRHCFVAMLATTRASDDDILLVPFGKSGASGGGLKETSSLD
jgi:hypothetical protein